MATKIKLITEALFLHLGPIIYKVIIHTRPESTYKSCDYIHSFHEKGYKFGGKRIKNASAVYNIKQNVCYVVRKFDITNKILEKLRYLPHF